MTEDFIQKLHDDVWQVLHNDAEFTHIHVFRSRTPLATDAEGDPLLGQSAMIEEQIEQALGGVNQKNGRGGIVAIVLLPDVKPVSVESLGPSLEMTVMVRVIEDRLINEAEEGTGIKATQLAQHIVQLLQRRTLDGFGCMRPDAERMMQEISLPDDRKAMEVRMVLSRSVSPLAKVAKPTVSRDTNVITCTCTTADAVIYYTVNGSFPGPQNPAAIVYEFPVEVSADDTLRVAAYAPQMQCSDDVRV